MDYQKIPQPDIVSYKTLIFAYVNLGYTVFALRLFIELKDIGLAMVGIALSFAIITSNDNVD